ncbi:unnamed protein product [Coregonus sp. 'balchen']|nr:unnamed protein product [Coregonus sp. 'balchen']
MTLVFMLSLTSGLLYTVNGHPLVALNEVTTGNEDMDTTGTFDSDIDVSDLIEAANENLGIDRHDPLILFGDIAMETGIRNASPCTARDCKWPKSRNGVVTVPVYISSSYTLEEQDIIIKGLISFHLSTCIQFVWWKQHQDYLYFHPGNGCWSYLGRRGGQQVISLQQRGCVHHGTVQHEVLHALGFHHEQNRSDRDNNVTIVTENISKGKEHNFRKVETNNLMTPYDYTSVMHYGRYAFSKDYGKLPTIIPKPDSNVQIGGARQMSRLDIVRVNRLYNCREHLTK